MSSPATAAAAPVREIDAAEVAKHKSPSDCWLIISGRVYDVTSFLSRHPAGSKIILLHGGRDCTAAFLDVHSLEYLHSFLPQSAFLGVVKGSAAAAAPIKKHTGRMWEGDQVLSSPRTVYSAEHSEWRERFRSFMRARVTPLVYSRWERDGSPDADLLRDLVSEGFYLRFAIPKEFGGLGLTDWRYSASVTEVLEEEDLGSFFLNLGNDMVLSYFTQSATPDQRSHWLPRIVQERLIIAIAMSEPEVGSDLAALGTVATKRPDGSWELSGRKMWISAGAVADLVVVAAVTDRPKGSAGISLFVVERGMEGFEVAKRFAKVGKHASDTCLLTLNKVVVPARNLIGREGEGFKYLMSNLSKERLSIAVGSAAAARRALALTLTHVHGRQMFGGVAGQLQSVAQRVARLRTQIECVSAFVDRCILAQSEGKLSAETASMAKVAATELACRVADECLQLFGGYGYLKNNPVAKIWQDQRVTRIYGGANEVLLEVAAKGLGFKPQRMYNKKSKL